MPKRFAALLLSLLVLTVVDAAGVAVAGPYSHLAARRGGETDTGMDQAVQRVRRETGGRVLSADRVERGGRAAYRIKVLTPSGHVRVYTIDAQTERHR